MSESSNGSAKLSALGVISFFRFFLIQVRCILLKSLETGLRSGDSLLEGLYDPKGTTSSFIFKLGHPIYKLNTAQRWKKIREDTLALFKDAGIEDEVWIRGRLLGHSLKSKIFDAVSAYLGKSGRYVEYAEFSLIKLWLTSLVYYIAEARLWESEAVDADRRPTNELLEEILGKTSLDEEAAMVNLWFQPERIKGSIRNMRYRIHLREIISMYAISVLVDAFRHHELGSSQINDVGLMLVHRRFFDRLISESLIG